MQRPTRTLSLIAVLAAAFASPALAADSATCESLVRSQGLTPLFYRECATEIHLCDPRFPHAVCLQSLAKLGLVVVRDLAIADSAEILKPQDSTMGSQIRLEPNRRMRMIEGVASPMSFSEVERLSAKDLLKQAAFVPPAAPGTPAKPFGDPEVERAWGIAAVGAPLAWARGVTGKGVKVAVIDTGIDYTHHDLAKAYIGGRNVVDPSRPNDPKDDQGHGTHVSGTIAAAKDGVDVVGVAPDAQIVAVKVLDSQGSGTYAHVIDGIGWAVEHNVNVISMSLGGPSSEAVCRAVKKSMERGILLVAAAGNDPRQPVGSPADCPGAIAISAMAQNGTIANFSSRGPQVAFIAPGVNVPSDKMGGGVVAYSGTSMATPHVAGLAALAIQLAGTSAGKAVYETLVKAARPLPSLKPVEQGRGLINAGLWFEGQKTMPRVMKASY